MKFEYHYSADDVLSIYNYDNKVKESVQVSDDIVLDFEVKDNVVGIEVFYASEFFNNFNKEIDKSFLENLEDAYLEFKFFRNQIFVVVVLQGKGKKIYQPMPPLRKSEYVMPFLRN